MRYIPFLLALLMSACSGKGKESTASAADTTRVIELALKTVMTESFPEIEGIRRQSVFRDSVFLTTSLMPLSMLPSDIDSFHFKPLADSLICSAIRQDTGSAELPNYLALQAFEKTDSGYFLTFESIDCVPSPSRDGAVSLHILKTEDRYIFNKK
jgi:hypothetical protein